MMINIAYEKHATQSSYSDWSKPGEAVRATLGKKNGGFAFHTKFEDRPWWQVDLDRIHTIDSIVVYNRDRSGSELASRADSLEVLTSHDGMHWESLHAEHRPFGGAIDNLPLQIPCHQKGARFVRLQLQDKNYLHLDSVEVLAEEPVPSLRDIGARYGTDKVTHGFCDIYERAFSRTRTRVTKMLELGVFFGASLRMWCEWFPNAQVHGADHFTGHQGNGRVFANADRFLKDVAAHRHPQITLHQLDQSDREALSAFARAQIHGTFDIIIDDASHLMKDQQLTFGVLFGLLKPGGHFVIEDLHSSLCKDYDVLADASNSTLLMIQRALQGHGWKSAYLSTEEQAFLDRHVDLGHTVIHQSGTSLTCILARRALQTVDQEPAVQAASVAIIDYASFDSLNQSRQAKHIAWARQWSEQSIAKPDNRIAMADVVCFGPDTLDPAFVDRHHAILDSQRGGGYWLWKPYIIATMLASTSAEFVVYCDSGSTLLQPLDAVVDALRSTGAAVLTFDLTSNGWYEQHWTKGQVLRALDATDPDMLKSGQLAGTASVWRVCEVSRMIAGKWLSLMLDPDLTTDAPSADGGGDYPGFREHRHDQSVFSVLIKQIMKGSDPGRPIAIQRDFRTWVGHHRIS